MYRFYWIITVITSVVVGVGICGCEKKEASQAEPEEPAAFADEPKAADAPPVAKKPPTYIFCEEVGQKVPPGDCDYFRQLAEHVKHGAAAFNAPDPMVRDELITLQLAIAPTDSAATTPTPLSVVKALPGTPIEYVVNVGRFMSAELTGDGFDIEPSGPRSQEVLHDSVTTWDWRVTARKSGVHALTLKTVVEGDGSDGKRLPLRSTTRNESVMVRVGSLAQIKDVIGAAPEWLKGLTAVLAALAGLIAGWFGLKKACKNGKADGA